MPSIKSTYVREKKIESIRKNCNGCWGDKSNCSGCTIPEYVYDMQVKHNVGTCENCNPPDGCVLSKYIEGTEVKCNKEFNKEA